MITHVNREQKKRVRRLLIEDEITIAALARKIGRSRTWTSQVLYGHRKSAPTRRAIARALGARVSDLWPNNGNGKAA